MVDRVQCTLGSSLMCLKEFLISFCMKHHTDQSTRSCKSWTMLNKSVLARFPPTFRKYIYHVYMIYTHWPLIKWLLHGLMCCGFRDAIPQPFVVTSGWVFVAFLWSPTCLTPDPWHQQYIFLHISSAHCTIIYLFVCLFSVCGRVIILSRDGWDVVKISVDCFGNQKNQQPSGTNNHHIHHVQSLASPLSSPLWCSLWTPASCLHQVYVPKYTELLCVEKQLNILLHKLSGDWKLVGSN